jgi:hypothetical protein
MALLVELAVSAKPARRRPRLQNVRRNNRDVKGEGIFHFGRGILVLGVDVQNIPVEFIEPHAVAPPTTSAMRAVIAWSCTVVSFIVPPATN